MKRRKSWLLIGLATWLVGAICGGTECRFFRIECLDGEAPENLAITLDESGQSFLEFDTVEGNTYSIEATDSLSPPAWTAVWTLTGDGQRATWLTASRRWSRTFGGTNGDGASSVQQTADGGYIVAGSTYSFGAGDSDVYLIKTDQNGEIGKGKGWTKTFGGTNRDPASSVQQTSDGGYIVAGWTESFGAGNIDVYLIKTDRSGSEVWSRTFGGSHLDQAWSVQQTSDGGYIVAAWTRSFGAGGYDVYLIKTDANGDEVWSRTFGGSGWDSVSSVQQTSDGGYIVAGSTESFGAGDRDAYLIKTDADGNEVWSRTTFGGSGWDSGSSVQQTSDGGYIVAGSTNSFSAGWSDVYLVKTDQNGNAPPPTPAPTGVTVWGDEFEEHTPLYGAIGGPWTVISGSNDPVPGDPADHGTWRLWNTLGDPLRNESPALDAMTGNYAIADSDLDSELLLNEELITPDIDCTNHRLVRLDFNMNYRAYAEDADHEQIAQVDIRRSNDGLKWSSWTNLLRWDRTTVADIESGSQQVDLSAIADGKHIQIRFHFYDAMYDYWFAVDDVRVSGFALP